MPKRIEHKIENGQELKWCGTCENWLELERFHTTNNRTWDNRFYQCKDCYNQKRENDFKVQGVHVYRNMLKRVAEHPHYLKRGVKVLMTEAEFLGWYKTNWFKGCLVDRIKNIGHYEIENIQTLTRAEHNYKLRQDRLDELGVIESDKERFCYTCEKLRPIKEFYGKKSKISKMNPLGLSEECKDCAKKKRNEYYKESHK